jgi:hypothetical protein
LEETIPFFEVDKDEEGKEEEQEVSRKKSQPKEIQKKILLPFVSL